MRVLGAVLAGGRSRRFGSDKALAEIEGRPMIERVIAALAAQTDAVVICGRVLDNWETRFDVLPEAGPLGGLAAALGDGQRRGFDAVLSAPCDMPDLPETVRAALEGRMPAYVEDQPVVGLWPCALADALLRHVEAGGRSLRSWTDLCGAVPVALGLPLANINTRADLAAWSAAQRGASQG